jgi:hypothetical protein
MPLFREVRLEVVVVEFKGSNEVVVETVVIKVLFVEVVTGGVVVEVVPCTVDVIFFGGCIGFVPAELLLVGC